MSVLACDRNCCGNIMCDRLILDGAAYICNYCYDELIIFRKTWPKEMPLNDVRKRIEAFMRTEPNATVQADDDEIEREFQRLT